MFSANSSSMANGRERIPCSTLCLDDRLERHSIRLDPVRQRIASHLHHAREQFVGRPTVAAISPLREPSR